MANEQSTSQTLAAGLPLVSQQGLDVIQVETSGSKRLDRSLVHGIAWTGAGKWLSQALSWLSTILVIRLLSPDDYGIFGMAMIYLGLVMLVNEFGLGAAVVANRDLSREQIAQINGLCLSLGIAAFFLSCLAAVPLAHFFRASAVRDVVIVMSVSFILASVKTVPSALLERDLKFKVVAIVDGVQAVAQAASTVVLAYLGYEYWALVFGGLIGMALSSSVLVTCRPHPMQRPYLGTIGKALTFSWHVLMTRIMWYAYSNTDFMVVGRVLGQTALGFYTVGWNLAQMPLEKITGLISRVSFPLFSAVQHDKNALRRYLLMLTEGIALLTFPVAFGLAIVADQFVPVVMGEKWNSAIPALTILAAMTALRAIVPPIPQVLTVTGEARFSMYNGIMTAVLAPIFFFVGAFWGIVGVAAAWLVLQPVTMAPVYWLMFRKLDLSPMVYLGSLWPALLGSAAMILAVLGLRMAVPAEWPLAIRLAINVCGGGAVYLATVWSMHGDRLKGFVHLLRSAKD